MNLTLDDLLNQIRTDMEKSAEEETKGEDKEDKKEEKSEDKGDGKEEKKMPPWLKDKKDEGGEDKSDKDEGGEEKKASAELTPAEAGAALAREIMEKAAAAINKDEQPMNKQAQIAGNALAQTLLDNLKKQANAGDVTVTDGGPAEGTVPNKVHADVMKAESEGAATIKPMMTGDGVRNFGTINEIFDAMVQDALSQGAASEQQVHGTGYAAPEGNAESGVPNQVKVASEQELENELEKAAAVEHLVEQGVDFEDAVALVKQAAVEIEAEMEKAAALNELMAEGVNFDQAVELIKQANAGDVTVMDGGAAPGTVPNKVQMDVVKAEGEGDNAIKAMPTGDGVRNQGTINQIFDGIVQDALAQGAASEQQVHGSGYAAPEGNAESGVPNQVKVAAVERMVEAGVDFNEAVEFVKEAAEKARDSKPSDALRGMISPAWMKNHISHKHTGKGISVGDGVKTHLLGGLRAGGRAIVEGVGGAAGGAGLGALVGGSISAARGRSFKSGAGIGAMGGGIAGEYTGAMHGGYASYRNQADEMHAKFKNEKKAELNKEAGALVPRTQLATLAKPGMSLGKKLAIGAGAAAAVGGVAGATVASSRNQEKKAAFDALVEAGVDFNEAAELVAAKARELYGE